MFLIQNIHIYLQPLPPPRELAPNLLRLLELKVTLKIFIIEITINSFRLLSITTEHPFLFASDSDQKSMIDLFRLIGRKTIDFFFDHGIY